MSKQKVRIRAARLTSELDGRIELATKIGGFSNPSAFIRAAIERELAGRESGVDAAEERIAASLDRVVREIRGVKLGSRRCSRSSIHSSRPCSPVLRNRRGTPTIRPSPVGKPGTIAF